MTVIVVVLAVLSGLYAAVMIVPTALMFGRPRREGRRLSAIGGGIRLVLCGVATVTALVVGLTIFM